MASKTIKLKDLRAATAASVNAVLGKTFIRPPGVLAGFLTDEAALNRLGTTASKLAKDVAGQVSRTSGIRVTPAIKAGPGGILVGYIQPRLFKR